MTDHSGDRPIVGPTTSRASGAVEGQADDFQVDTGNAIGGRAHEELRKRRRDPSLSSEKPVKVASERRGGGGQRASDTEQARRIQQQQAQRLENLGQLAGGIAHDFNNLLAVIVSYTSLASEDLDAATDADWAPRLRSARNDLGEIATAADRATKLTRQLVAFARRKVIQPQVTNLDEVVMAIREILRRTIGAQIELVTSLAGDLGPVLVDPGQMEQVLMNLAVNARDAMPGGGRLTIRTTGVGERTSANAEADSEPRSPRVRILVSDTGTGMTTDVVERAFEPFFTTKGAGAGAGLGLSTVYGIVTQADGDIEIDTEPGVGTTFRITLPITAETTIPDVLPPSLVRTPSGETVLIVEDEEALRLVTERMLKRHGYQVIVAANGRDALELAAKHTGEIHLLLTDVVMPGMLGKEVAQKMRAIKPGIEVLYMSGYAESVLASQGRLELGVTLLEKPFSEAELLAKSAEVLDGHFPGFKTTRASSA